jgi:hypothetical protein
MVRISSILVAVVLCGSSFFGPALAGADDYGFELVNAELPKGDAVPVLVRLVDKKTGKPVMGAIVIRSRIDMAPEGMAEHATAIKAAPSKQPGVYAFNAELSMEGRWQLSLAAKVQGETETVVGKVILKVGK